MPSQPFLSLSVTLVVLAVILAGVVLSFFVNRRSMNAPSRLKMGGTKWSPSAGASLQPKSSSPSEVAPETQEWRPRREKPKNLNIFFNYNGHSWDAYEVLGVPAGSSYENIVASFNEACATTQTESHEFLKAALVAIKKDFED